MLGQTCALQAPMRTCGLAPPLPPRPARKPTAAAVRCSQQPASQEPCPRDRQASLVALARMGMLVAVSSAVVACQAPAAQAAAQGWQPRRHAARTLREQFVTHETPKQVGTVSRNSATEGCQAPAVYCSCKQHHVDQPAAHAHPPLTGRSPQGC